MGIAEEATTMMDGFDLSSGVPTTFYALSSSETVATDPTYQVYTTIIEYDTATDLNSSLSPSTSHSYDDDFFYYIPLAERIVETILLSVIWFMAFWGNLLLWIVVFRRKSLKTVTNAMVLCLSAADLLVSIVNLPFTIFTVAKGEWIFGTTMCVILGFMTMLTFVASVMSLAAIGICRYLFIVHPEKFRRWYTRKHTAWKIAGVWLFSGLLACPPLLGWGIYDYLPRQSFCFCDWTTSVSYTFFMVGVCFGGPCSVMTFCYVQILRVVRQSRKRVDTSVKKRNSTTSNHKVQVPPVTVKVPSTSDSTATNKNDNNDENRHSIASVASSNCPSGASGQTDCTTISGQTSNNLQVPSGKYTRNSKSSEHNGQKSNDNDNHSKQQQEGGMITRKISHEGASNISSTSDASELGGAANLQMQRTDSSKTPHSDKQSIVIEEDRPTFLNRLSHHGGSMLKSMSVNRNIRRRATENERQKRRRQEELKLTKSFVVVIFCFIICWLPFCVAMFWSVFGKNPPPRIFDMSTLILGYFNSCCNPIIYGVMNNKFRAGYKAILCKPCNRRKNKGAVSLNSSLVGDQGSIINNTYSQNPPSQN